MAELKTKENKASVSNFINSVEDPQKRADCKKIARLITESVREMRRIYGGR
jgi:hypothetical protein